MEQILVNADNVTFAYQTFPVLKGANLTIARGDYLGLIGPNGSAKSTLIKLILGVLKPQGGTIKLFGSPIEQFRAWGRIGYVSQNANHVNDTFPATVDEIVSIGLYPTLNWTKRITSNGRAKITEALDIVGMTHLRTRLVGNLSGGQRQKVFIARALVSSPDLLFLDEPTVGIDASSQLKFYDLLDQLNKDLGVTIVLVSHDIGIITEKVSRIACMEGGQVFVHDTCCAVPVTTFLEELYGDQMSLMRHRHHHGHQGVPNA